MPAQADVGFCIKDWPAQAEVPTVVSGPCSLPGVGIAFRHSSQRVKVIWAFESLGRALPLGAERVYGIGKGLNEWLPI